MGVRNRKGFSAESVIIRTLCNVHSRLLDQYESFVAAYFSIKLDSFATLMEITVHEPIAVVKLFLYD